jgi:hypothetical protein
MSRFKEQRIGLRSAHEAYAYLYHRQEYIYIEGLLPEILQVQPKQFRGDYVEFATEGAILSLFDLDSHEAPPEIYA